MNKYTAAANRSQLNMGIAHVTKRLKEIVVCPETSLGTKRVQADANIKMLLEDVLPLLPKGKQREIQTCLDLHEDIWHPQHATSQLSTQTDGSFPTSQAK